MNREIGRKLLSLVAAGALFGLLAPAAQGANPAPYGLHDAGGFYNVLPAGEAGNENFVQLAEFQANKTIPPHFNDQLPLYQNLVYADPTLTPGEIPHYFKDATFGVKPQHVASVEHPEAGLTIVRDQWDVPHIYGVTRDQTEFGAGYAAAEDRLFMIDVLRHYAEGKLSSFVGGSPSDRAMDESQWELAPYTQADLQSQLTRARQFYGAAGVQLVHDADNFVAGINARLTARTSRILF